MTILDTLGGAAEANNLNSHGDVVGSSVAVIEGQPRWDAFLSAVDADGNRLPMIDLNTFVAPDSGWHLQSAADINDDSEIVGHGYLNGHATAFLFHPTGGVVDLGTLVVQKLGGDADDSAVGFGINNQGDVTGDWIIRPGNFHEAYLYLGDTQDVIPLGRLDGRRTLAAAIGDRDASGNVRVTGYLKNDDGTTYHAFRYTFDTIRKQGIVEDLGELKRGFGSWASDINDLGVAVGTSGAGPMKYHPFRYSDQTGMKDLGTLGGDWTEGASGINHGGKVVGRTTLSNGANRAFLYSDELGMMELETLIVGLPDSLVGCLGSLKINGAGDISGTTTDRRAFFLRPQNP